MKRVKLTLPLLSLFIAALALVAGAAPSIVSTLELSRADFYPWMLFSAHLTHWSHSHLWWDTMTFLLLGSMYELGLFAVSGTLAQRRRELLLELSIAAPIIAFSVLIFAPAVQHYRGLSGLCVSVFTMLLLDLNTKGRADGDMVLRVFAFVGLGALFAKILFEALSGEALFAASAAANYTVVYVAHVAGALSPCATKLWGRGGR